MLYETESRRIWFRHSNFCCARFRSLNPSLANLGLADSHSLFAHNVMWVFGIIRSLPFPIFFLLLVLHYKFALIKLKEGHQRSKGKFKTSSIICVWSSFYWGSLYNGSIDINKVQPLNVENPEMELRTRIYSENLVMPRPGYKIGLSAAALKFVKAQFMLIFCLVVSGP